MLPIRNSGPDAINSQLAPPLLGLRTQTDGSVLFHAFRNALYIPYGENSSRPNLVQPFFADAGSTNFVSGRSVARFSGHGTKALFPMDGFCSGYLFSPSAWKHLNRKAASGIVNIWNPFAQVG
jgi:hypothetical protein